MLKDAIAKASSKYPFGSDDIVQQIIGSAILTSPFLFTEEVWHVADNTSTLQSAILISISLSLGHGILYVAKQDRDWDLERKFLGITVRYISLMAISFGTILLILSLTGVRQTFGAGMFQTMKAVSILSIFAIIGAATADNLI